MPRKKQSTPERKAKATQNTQRWRQKVRPKDTKDSQPDQQPVDVAPVLSKDLPSPVLSQAKLRSRSATPSIPATAASKIKDRFPLRLAQPRKGSPAKPKPLSSPANQHNSTSIKNLSPKATSPSLALITTVIKDLPALSPSCEPRQANTTPEPETENKPSQEPPRLEDYTSTGYDYKDDLYNVSDNEYSNRGTNTKGEDINSKASKEGEEEDSSVEYKLDLSDDDTSVPFLDNEPLSLAEFRTDLARRQEDAVLAQLESEAMQQQELESEVTQQQEPNRDTTTDPRVIRLIEICPEYINDYFNNEYTDSDTGADANNSSYSDVGDTYKNDIDNNTNTCENDINNDTDATIDEDNLVDYPAELAQHLRCFHGCISSTHERTRQEHFTDEARYDNHTSLAEIVCDLQALPDVLCEPGVMKSNSPHRQKPPNWPLAFEGICSEGDNKDKEHIHVCLESSEQAPRPTRVQFDIDSLVGFADSLAFAKQGILIDLAPQFVYNIQTNLHLYYPVIQHTPRGPQQVQVKLQDIPHYRLGRVLGQDDISVYLFFPAQYDSDKPTNFPGKRDGQVHKILQEWTDDILLPAVAKHLPSDVAQHFPTSWLGARLGAQSRNREAQVQVDKGTSRYQSLYYPLMSPYLHDIWLAIQEAVQMPEYTSYVSVQIALASKNTKVMFKASTPAQAYQQWQSRTAAALDFEHLDDNRVWLDLGKETICQDWAFSHQPLSHSASPAVYLYRTCCLESFFQWSLFGESATKASKVVYTPAMLDKCSDMTIEMPFTSQRRKKGWVFSQLYNSVKEIVDVAKVKPFQNASLSRLAWDPKVDAMIAHQGRGSVATRNQLLRSYTASKVRLAQALTNNNKKSFGVREEHRITLAFLKKMTASLPAAGTDDPVESDRPDLPFWELASEGYLAFLASSANKFLLAFEWVLTLNNDQSINYEHCKVLAMLLQALTYTYDSGLLKQVTGLWKDEWQQKQPKRVQRLGMGIGTTLHELGYGWFLPRIDWATLTFRLDTRDTIKYCDTALRDVYRRRWASVKDVKDDLGQLEMIGQWLGLYSESKRAADFVLRGITELTTCHFRKELFRSIRKEVRPEYLDLALNGGVMLCAQELRRVLRPKVEADEGTVEGTPEETGDRPVRRGRPRARKEQDVSPSDSTDSEREHEPRSPSLEPQAKLYIVCSRRQQKYSLEQVVDLLWDHDDGQVRKGWENRGYRSLHRRALEIVTFHGGPNMASRLHKLTKQVFVSTAWILPQVNKLQFLRKNSKKERIWLSLYHRRWVHDKPAGTQVDWEELQRDWHDDAVQAYQEPQPEETALLSSDEDLDGHKTMAPLCPNMPQWALVTSNQPLSMEMIPTADPQWSAQQGVDARQLKQIVEETWAEDTGED